METASSSIERTRVNSGSNRRKKPERKGENRGRREVLHYSDPRAREVLGCTEPRLWTRPLRPLTPDASLGFDAISFAEEMLGISLMPWQKWLLIHIFELLPTGKLRFKTVIIEVARQNGKSLLAQVICLYRLFVDDTRLVLGTAQNLDVAREVWMDAVQLAESSESLAGEVAKVTTANGKEQLLISVDLGEGGRQYRRWKVAAANRKGGRGLSADTVLMDELREQSNWDAWSAIRNTTMARENGLVIGISNAGDMTSVVLKERREIGINEINQGTANAIFSWSASEKADLDDVLEWAQANPALGYTVPLENLITARSDPETSFRTENLCQWVTAQVETYYDPELWRLCADVSSQVSPASKIEVAVDVAADRSRSYVSIAAFRPDGIMHVETVATREGMFWVVPYTKEVLDALGSNVVVAQARGCPAAELILEFQKEKIEVRGLTGGEVGFATGQFADRLRDGLLRHIDQPAVNVAVASAVAKRLANSWVLDRAASKTDIAPLVAETFAAYALTNEPLEEEVPPAPPPGAAVLEQEDVFEYGEADLATVAF